MDEHSFHIHFTDEAKENHQQIKHYLLKEFGNHVFKIFKEQLLHTLSLISANPHLFPLINENKKIYRAVVRKELSVFYEINEKKVMILSLFDKRRNTTKF